MSRTLKVVMLSLIGFSFGAGATKLYQAQSQSSSPLRKSASVEHEKIKMLAGKSLSNLQVRIAMPDDLPIEDDKETTLTGLVLVTSAREEVLQYEWELPAGVDVIEGHTSDALPGIAEGQTARIDLKVRGFSSENLKLAKFKAYYASSEGQFGNTAIISSRPQDSFEFIAPTAVGEAGINPRPRIQK